MADELGASPPAGLPSPGVSDPLVGATLVGRYEILGRIGEGGMGAVYEGRHVVLGKRVAVKVLLEKFLEKQDLVARLLQEARLASAIGHEHIVDVADFGTTEDGRSFVVMEFLEGESLAAVVSRDAPLPVERCLRIARQVASALAAAHDKGIVHRDIKPENVFLLPRGEADFAKVMDFGVSKAVHSRDEGADLLRLTRTGMVLGTPLYMSPEQARGEEDIDGRADVWALGVMLYECLTGEVPFRAKNYLGVISQVLTEAVEPPSRIRPELEIPASVEAVVMRAMEKDRARRYQHMSDLEGDLGRLLAGDPNVGLAAAEAVVPAALPTRVRSRWHLLVVGAVVVAAGIALVLKRADDDPPAGTALDATKARRRVGQAAPVVGAAASRTGQASGVAEGEVSRTGQASGVAEGEVSRTGRATPPASAASLRPTDPVSAAPVPAGTVLPGRRGSGGGPERLRVAPERARAAQAAKRVPPERTGAEAPAAIPPAAPEKKSLDEVGSLEAFKAGERAKPTR